MPFLFLRDGNPLRHIRRPHVTWGLIAANIAVYLLTELGLVDLLRFGLPADFGVIADHPDLLVTHLFLHGNLLHLAGNMLVLFIFGDNVEDSMGHLRFLIFYLLCGVGSAVLFTIVSHDSRTLIGASGAISGILAGYLLLHPRARVLILAAFKFPVIAPSWIVIALYVLFDVIMAFAGGHLGAGNQNIGWWGHIGGFMAGIALVRAFKFRDVPLFAAAVHYPETPFPELERDGKGKLRRLIPFMMGAPKARAPLSRRAAIIVVLLKALSYISLLIFLSLEYRALAPMFGLHLP